MGEYYLAYQQEGKHIHRVIIMKKINKISIALLLVISAGFAGLSQAFLNAQTANVKDKADVTAVEDKGNPGKNNTATADEKSAVDVKKDAEAPDTSIVENAANEPVEVQGNSLFTTVKQGGPLMIFLVLLALASLTIIIERLIFFSRNKVWKNEEVESMISLVREGSTSTYREDLEDDLRSFYQVYVNGVERGLALLSGIGNIAPIVGFLGTVIGMIKAFASIAAATTVNAKVVAVGIQIALVTTAGGLLVAAPTLAFYYLFTHVLQNRYARMEELIAASIDEMPRISDRLCQE